MLSGSRVTSFASKYSDIDVYIILSDDVEWRERGNKMIDGCLIEYFANPIKQIKSYFKEEFEKIVLLLPEFYLLEKYFLIRLESVRS